MKTLTVAVLALFLTLVLASLLLAQGTTPPPTPHKRKAYSLAAFYFELGNGGENEFKLAMDNHMYDAQDTYICSELEWTTDFIPTKCIEDFQSELESGDYGTYFVDTHGDEGVILTEVYPATDPGRDARDARYAMLTQTYAAYNEQTGTGYIGYSNPVDSNGEIVAYTIDVSTNFVELYAKLAEESIVFLATCHGADAGPNGKRMIDAYVKQGHAMNAFGYTGTSSGSQNIADIKAIFWSMCGMQGVSGNDTRMNYTVVDAWNFGLNKSANLRRKSLTDDTVLYNAPRILRLFIEQPVGSCEYRYQYAYEDWEEYPFDEGQYPGNLSDCETRPCGPGEMDIFLLLSKNMDFDWGNTLVQLDPQGPGAGFAAADVTKFHCQGYKYAFGQAFWEGRVTVPSEMGDFWDGECVLVARMRDNYLDDSKQMLANLDIDGDGKSNGHQDHVIWTLFKFNIDTTKPIVKPK
jgi:hypothetical protein